MRTGCIYIIKNTVNKVVYIGQTTFSIHERFMQHMKPSMHKKNYKLYKAIEKIGRENFYVELLESDIDVNDLDDKEIFYIKKFNSYKRGYNSTPGGDGRVINKIEDEDKIIELAKSGKTSIEIAEFYEVSISTIFRILRKYNFKYIEPISKEDIIKCLDEKMSNKEMVEHFNVDTRTITRTLKRYGLTKYKGKIILRKDFDFDSFKNDYMNNVDINYIINKYDISKTSAYKLAKKMNITENRSSSKIAIKETSIKSVLKLKSEGCTAKEIRAITGLSNSFIYKCFDDEKCND